MKISDSDKVGEKLLKDVQKYVELRTELLRLSVLEKLANTTSFLISVIVMLLILFFAAIILHIALGFVLSDLLGSMTLGFGAMAIFYLFLAILVLNFRKRIFQNFLYNAAVENIFYDIDKAEEDD